MSAWSSGHDLYPGALERGAVPHRAGPPPAAPARLRDGGRRGRALGRQRIRVEGDPRLGRLVAAADRGPVHRGVPRTGADPGRHGAGSAEGAAEGAAVPGRVRRVRARVRAVVLLPRDPPARDRDRAPRPVPRAAPRRPLGPLRLPRARAAPGVARAGARALGARPDRRRATRRDGLDCRDPLRGRGGGHLHALHPPRRACGRRPRRGSAARVGFRLRGALLRE